MARVKTGPYRHRRHKEVLKLTKGYRMTKNRLYKVAHEAMMHAGQYAYIGRKLRKRNFRRLWITRITAAVKQVSDSMNYSRLIHGLNQKGIKLDRKIMAELAVHDPEAFKKLVETVQAK